MTEPINHDYNEKPIGKPSKPRGVDVIIFVLVAICVTLMLVVMSEVVVPPSDDVAESEITARREQFNREFGLDRTTVREAEHYRTVDP